MSEHTPTLLKADENYVRPVKYITRRPYICAVRFCQEGGADPETQGNADRIAATWNAFHSPDGRKIATEDIAPGVVFRLRDQLVNIFAIAQGMKTLLGDEYTGTESHFEQARVLISTLKVQEPEK